MWNNLFSNAALGDLFFALFITRAILNSNVITYFLSGLRLHQLEELVGALVEAVLVEPLEVEEEEVGAMRVVVVEVVRVEEVGEVVVVAELVVGYLLPLLLLA